MMTAYSADSGALEHLVRRAHAEYMEMPGLCLTCRQAQRLWGLDEANCSAVLCALVKAGFHFESTQGFFIRTEMSSTATVNR